MSAGFFLRMLRRGAPMRQAMRNPWMRRGLLVAGLTTLVHGSLLAQEPAGKRYALLVGVKDYGIALKPLDYTENDGIELADLLGGHGYQVTVLTDSEGKHAADRQPTTARIRQQLAALVRRKARRDTVLVAFAGHGIQSTIKGDDGKHKEEAFLRPQDAQPPKEITNDFLLWQHPWCSPSLTCPCTSPRLPGRFRRFRIEPLKRKACDAEATTEENNKSSPTGGTSLKHRVRVFLSGRSSACHDGRQTFPRPDSETDP